MKSSKNNTLRILLISFGLIIGYAVLLIVLKNFSCCLELNEFGDYVGGVLNPLFGLLSTLAIIYLTYIIAKNDDKKADESISTQKRITLNQMRQEALNSLISKLNLFVYQLDKIPVHDVKAGTLVQRVLTNNLKKEGKEATLVWVMILFELESFLQLKYLFTNLFIDSEFKDAYDSLVEIIEKLIDEQNSIKIVSPETLGKYIELKQKFVTKIGDFILSEF